MYLEYYGFHEEPFNITPNSRFLFLSERHREALASLHYGIEQRKGFIALTGEIGCGKTTICRALLGRLDREQVRLALILNPELSDLELLQAINSEFGIQAKTDSKRELIEELNRFLLREYEEDRNVVLLVDEAQRLSPAALEQVRLLSNLETETTKLIQIALVGQPELADILDLPELEQLNQRITVRFHIEPLSEKELAEYIAHRITVAEAVRNVRFSPKALRRVYQYSGGVPRRVNVVCDRALLVAYTREQDEVDEACVTRAIEEVGGRPRRNRHGAAAPPPSRTNWKAPPPEEPEPEPVAAGAGRGGSLVMGVAVLAVLVAVAYGISEFANRQDAAPHAELAQAPATPPEEPGTPADPAPGQRAQAPAPGALADALLLEAEEEAPAPSPAPSPTPSPEPTPAPPEEPEEAVADATEEPGPPAGPAEVAQAAEAVTEDDEPGWTPSVESPDTPGAPEPDEAAEEAELVEVTEPPEEEVIAEPAEVTVGQPWRYDADGVLRAPGPEFSYPAAVLTWLESGHGERLGESELDTLASMTPDRIARLRLTQGAPPLHLREARLAASLQLLRPGLLPVLVQVDSEAPGYGPWTVLEAHGEGTAVLLDPGAGRLNVPVDQLEDHLTAVVVLFFDPEQLVGLGPQAEGQRVRALQQHLREHGLYRAEPTGIFDPLTEAALDRFREEAGLAQTGEVDSLTVLHLLVPPESES